MLAALVVLLPTLGLLCSGHRSCPHEVRAIEDMVTALEYRHVPTGTLAVLAQRLGKVWASPSTWDRLVRQNGWRRPRLRVHPVSAGKYRMSVEIARRIVKLLLPCR